jgi:hypothetical protein
VFERGGQGSFALFGLRLASLFVMLERTKLLARGRPALPRCADSESGDKMMDRVLLPVIGFAVARSLEAVQADGRWRQAPFGSRPQTIVVTTGRRADCVRSSCGDHILGAWRGLDRSERLVAELAQDVEGASAELASNRQTGAVVIDPPSDLTVVPVVG